MEDLEIDVDPVERNRRGRVALGCLELIRVWMAGDFRLELFDTGRVDDGKPRLGYRFFDSRMGEEPVFEGEDIRASPVDAIDSDSTVAGILTFLAFEPIDVGWEYFEGYSERQMEWVESYAEELAELAFELRVAGE